MLERRPVAVAVWLKVVWMRPVSGSISSGSASRYVLFSFVSSRQVSILGTISCSSRIWPSTLASVEKPVLPRRFLVSSRSTNSTSASCWGEPIVNSFPASSKMSASSCAIRFSNPSPISARRFASSLTPVRSTSASTSTSGISTSSMRRSSPFSFIDERCRAASSQTSRASAAASAISSSSDSAPSSIWPSPSLSACAAASATSLAAARPRCAAISGRSYVRRAGSSR